MTTNLTREAVQEAVNLGTKFMPKFTATELAAVLGVPLVYALRVIQANQKYFKFDTGRNILGLDATSTTQTMNSNEVWNWYLKNVLGGNAKRCLPLSDQTKLNAVVNSRVKWDVQFTYAAATFATNDKTGQDVVERAINDYGPDISSRLTRLGTINGAGQIPDRFLFGLIVSDQEFAARKIGDLLLYTSEWAMERMLGTIDWVVVSLPAPKSGVSWIPTEQATRGLPLPSEVEGEGERKQITLDVGGAGEDDAAILTAAAKAAAKAADPATTPQTEKKVNRRTKEQLEAERSRMNAELLELGAGPEVAVKCFNIEKFTEAEKFYKETKESLTKTITFAAPTAPPIASPESKVEPKVETLPDGQQELPGTAAAREVKAEPAPATPHRSSMSTLADLENLAGAGVAALKSDIASKAGMLPPLPPALSSPAAAVAAAPMAPTAPPIAPVQNPVPAGASADASDLLDNLLKSTGQS